MRICFFARVPDRDALVRVGFYAQDISALRELGHDVTIATRWSEIPWDSDLYFVWWWTWAFLPLIKAKLRLRPVLVTGVFNYDMGYEATVDYVRRSALQRWVIRFAARAASANVFLSRYELERVRFALPVRRPRYLPLGVDTDVFKPSSHERDRSLVFTIAWTSKENAERKCVANIIDSIPYVLKQIPNMRFVLAGAKGDASRELERRCAELGVSASVEWLGSISEDRKLSLLQSCGVYLSPSLYEGFGLAILEAMACGAPVVTSAVGAVPEVVGNAAVFVDGTRPDQIAAAVVSLQQDDLQRRELGGSARERAEALFDSRSRPKQIAEILAECLGGRVEGSG